MEDGNTPAAAANVAAAITAALDWSSPPDARRAAVSSLESVKNGDIKSLAGTSLLLVRKNCSSEIRLHGFKMLQHLVRFRWEELSASERRELANCTFNLVTEVVGPTEEWALKSQTAALVAEVIRREGIALWRELFPSIVSLLNNGPTEAELVAMILRWLPEDITVHNEDLEGDRRRELLRGLTESLSEILPLLYSLLERHFVSAVTEHANQKLDSAKQHAATVTAALNAVNAYAEWAPVTDLAKYGLIHGCSSLLPYNEFRLHACDFFKFICQRKRPVDGTALEFDSAMNAIFQILMNVSSDFLNKSRSNPSAIDESEYEFAECICESMVSLGSSNMSCIIGDSIMTSQFLQQMLEYYQHYRISLHFQSLLFWLALLRESAKAKSVSHASGDSSSSTNNWMSPVEKEKKGVSAFITDEICTIILDITLQRMLKKNALSEDSLQLWNDELDGKGDFSQYRSRLLDIIKLISSQKPLIAAKRVAQRIATILGSSSHVPPSNPEMAVMEGAQLGLETVIAAVFDGSAESVLNSNEETKFQLRTIFEGILQRLLAIKWTEPALAVILGHYLDSFGPYLKHFPESVASVVNKLFELLTSIPFNLNDPSANGARHARLQICTSFIRISKAAEKSLLPHMKSIADTMGYLQGEGRLQRGEHNLLCEAFLVMASSAGVQQQQEVLAWILEPLSKMWTPLEWQNAYLLDQFGLVRLCTESSNSQFMWSIYHNVTFFEKALKRSGIKKSALASAPKSMHPMVPHLPWLLPPLLRLIRAIHALWSQPVAQTLSQEMQGAKSMSSVEQAGLLGEISIKINSEGESKENDIRNWLKGTRDSGYNVIGLSATIGEPFYRSIEASSLTISLMENVQSMEFRHIRQLIHFVLVPLVKNCPVDLWETWVVNLLHPLFLHCQLALSCSWAGLLQEGRAKLPDSLGNLSGLELKVEVMEEKLLRDLTREVCSLLSAIANPGLNTGVPSLDQLGTNRGDQSSLKDLESFASTSLVVFLLLHKEQAIPALRITINVLNWTDGDAVSKLIPFCGVLVLLSIATNNSELRQFVTKDLFFAVIQGLALESNAIISAELVGLCREIYVYLSDRDPTPRQVLLSLPHIKQEDLLAFEEALSKTMSPKEQRQHMRSLLMLATGNQLKALAAQKTTNIITNVTARTRSSAKHGGPSSEDEGPIGLAAIT